MNDNLKGLYPKFRIERTDGRDAKGEKHENCEYFVLDATHDPRALKALRTYAADCQISEPVAPELASDLQEMIQRGGEAQGLTNVNSQCPRCGCSSVRDVIVAGNEMGMLYTCGSIFWPAKQRMTVETEPCRRLRRCVCR